MPSARVIQVLHDGPAAPWLLRLRSRQSARRLRIVAREDKRQCKKCDYAWYAVRVTPKRGATWSDTQTPLFNAFGNPDAKVTRKSARREESVRGYERWAICPRCGSQKVRTVIGSFAPTALTESRNANSPAPPPTASTHDGSLPIGTRVTLQVLGFRGKIGTITAYGEKGYTVKVDGGATARWVPPHKVTKIG